MCIQNKKDNPVPETSCVNTFSSSKTIFQLSKPKLLSLVFDLVCSECDLDSLQISRPVLSNALSKIADNYFWNPYHSLRHATDVVFSIRKLLCELDFELTPVERFAMLFSAFVHDVRHPGMSNTELKESAENKSEILPSMNERVSIKEGTNVIEETGLLKGMSEHDAATVLGVLHDTVLATDIFTPESIEPIKSNPAKQKRYKLALVLRMADVCNCFADFEVNVNWACRLHMELRMDRTQAVRERMAVMKNEFKERVGQCFQSQKFFYEKIFLKLMGDCREAAVLTKKNQEAIEQKGLEVERAWEEYYDGGKLPFLEEFVEWEK